MTGSALVLTLLTCLFCMGTVAWISYRFARNETRTQEGYFLAGRGLGGTFIAGSLLLTNLSAEQLIGLNGSAYGHNLSSMAWEVTAALATVLMAFIFLPRYLAGAFTTLPEFLRDRYDVGVQRLSAGLFMLGYGLITIPSVLYSGSLAVMQIFDVQTLLGVSRFEALCATILIIGMTGALYAIFGGLKAVAVSDTLNGIGLLAVGGLVPILGLIALGNGDFGAGLTTLVRHHPEKLNAIGGQTDPTPFGTLFTGMVFANLFYWCTNQYVIQRTLAAKSLAEGQKGVLLSGFFKVLVPFFMMIPGLIAFHLYGPGLSSIDEAYPRLIRDIFPTALMGVFLAVLLGAVFSSFNSLLNSAATLFVLDLYAPFRRTQLDDRQTVRLAMTVSIIIALFSFTVAPLLFFAPQGLWQIIRIFTGFYNIPIIAIVIMGLFHKRIPALGAKLAIGFHVIAYGLVKFALADIVTLHFLHLYAVLFGIEVAIMLAVAHLRPRQEAWRFKAKSKVDLTPWRYALPAALMLLCAVVGLYLLFSPIGLASRHLGASFWLPILALTVLSITAWAYPRRRNVPSAAKAPDRP